MKSSTLDGLVGNLRKELDEAEAQVNSAIGLRLARARCANCPMLIQVLLLPGERALEPRDLEASCRYHHACWPQGQRRSTGYPPSSCRAPRFLFLKRKKNLLAGPKGYKGPDGPVGAPGPIGPTGPPGPKGMTGVTGPKGVKGPDGYQGPQGAQGIKGKPGIQGQRGSEGPDGSRGPAGPDGTNGKDGPPGQLPVP